MSAIQRISTTAAAVFILGVAGAFATELPQYEVAGFPITPPQISILGSGGVQEQSPAATVKLEGMPASPHQLAVIGVRTKPHMADRSNKGADAAERTRKTTD